MSFTLVTAFLDLKRGNWTNYRRSVDVYFNAFHLYSKLDYPMIAFVDDLHLHRVKKWNNLTLIPINRDWLQDQSRIWKLIPRQKEILESAKHKALIDHRKHQPETHNAEYNAINHAKVDFLHYAIENGLVQTPMVAWTDFGFFSEGKDILDLQFPSAPLDPSAFDHTKVSYQCIGEIAEEDKNMIHTLKNPKPLIIGSFFAGTVPKIQEYRELYYQTLCDMHSQDIDDDDQHVALQAYLRRPDLIDPVRMNTYMLQYVYFQKDSWMRKERELVLVPSVLAPRNNAFSIDERIRQTHTTIESIRDKYPRAHIVFLEASEVPFDTIRQFRANELYKFNVPSDRNEDELEAMVVKAYIRTRDLSAFKTITKVSARSVFVKEIHERPSLPRKRKIFFRCENPSHLVSFLDNENSSYSGPEKVGILDSATTQFCLN